MGRSVRSASRWQSSCTSFCSSASRARRSFSTSLVAPLSSLFCSLAASAPTRHGPHVSRCRLASGRTFGRLLAKQTHEVGTGQGPDENSSRRQHRQNDPGLCKRPSPHHVRPLRRLVSALTPRLVRQRRPVGSVSWKTASPRRLKMSRRPCSSKAPRPRRPLTASFLTWYGIDMWANI